MSYHKYFCFEEGDEVFGERRSQLVGLCLQKTKDNQTGGTVFLLYSERVVRIIEPDPEILGQLWKCLCDPPETTTHLPRSASQKIERLAYKETRPANFQAPTGAELNGQPGQDQPPAGTNKNA